MIFSDENVRYTEKRLYWENEKIIGYSLLVYYDKK